MNLINRTFVNLKKSLLKNKNLDLWHPVQIKKPFKIAVLKESFLVFKILNVVYYFYSNRVGWEIKYLNGEK